MIAIFMMAYLNLFINILINLKIEYCIVAKKRSKEILLLFFVGKIEILKEKEK